MSVTPAQAQDRPISELSETPAVPIALAVEAAALRPVLERLPAGLQTALGEAGALLSGGEGQRVRFGRAWLRPEARLALLDEPFRGLDRHTRERLLTAARSRWSQATLLFVTHNIAETQEFDRVVVLDAGRVVEDDVPERLAKDPESRYSTLLRTDEAMRRELWSGAMWRRLRLERGYLTEETTRIGA